jgi:hypothetical protein
MATGTVDARRKGGSGRNAAHKGSIRASGASLTVSDKSIFSLPIADIANYDNPRCEPETLWDKGYILIGDADVEKPVINDKGKVVRRCSLKHLALSANIQMVEHFVRLLEQTETVDREKDSKRPQTILELAKDIKDFGQLEPIKVHRLDNTWVGDDGARRLCAVLYLHARDRVRIFRQEKDAPEKPFPAEVQATTLNCSESLRFVVSAKINLSRKGYTELQEGRVYHEMLKRVNPATLAGQPLFDPKYPDGRSYTKKEAALTLGVHPSTFRNREALWHPYKVVRRDGDLVLDRRGLTDEERAQIRDGKLLPTYASRLSLGESTIGASSASGVRVMKKHKALTLKEMEVLFDSTPVDQKDRRIAIAQCMRKSYDRALEESRSRVDDRMDVIERGMGRKKRRGDAA